MTLQNGPIMARDGERGRGQAGLGRARAGRRRRRRVPRHRLLRRVTTTWRIRRLVTVLAGARRFRLTRLVRANT